VALVAGLLHRRIAAGLGRSGAVGGLAQQAARAGHGMHIMTGQTGRLPHRRAGGEIAQAGGGSTVLLRRHRTVAVRRSAPARLGVAGQAHDVLGRIEGSVNLVCGDLKAIAAQELVVGGRIVQMRIVAGVALHLIALSAQRGDQRKLRPGLAAHAAGDRGGAARGIQLPIPAGLGGIIGKGNRMIVGQIDADIARVTGIGSCRAIRHDPACAGSLHGDAARRIVEHAYRAYGQRAVMAGQAQLGADADTRGSRIQSGQRTGVHRGRIVERIGLGRQRAVPQGRDDSAAAGCRMRRMAEHADLGLAGRLDGGAEGRAAGSGEGVACGKVVAGAGHIRHAGR